MHDDLERARAIVGDAPTIAVNGASREVKAFALCSIHPERFTESRWTQAQARAFGNDFSTHSYQSSLVDYVWPDTEGRGGSAWCARKLAYFMGFDAVVLCGCPLVVGPYIGGHNIGGIMHRIDVVEDLWKGIENDTDWHDGVYSMSGRTRDLLGEPE